MEPTKRYQITTIADLLAVPQDKLDAWFEDLKVWLSIRKAYDDLPESAREIMKLQDSMIWKDDGKTGISEIQIDISKEE